MSTPIVYLRPPLKFVLWLKVSKYTVFPSHEEFPKVRIVKLASCANICHLTSRDPVASLLYANFF